MLTTLHVWDQRTVNAARDLHWGLERAGVHSVQCVRRLELKTATMAPRTFAVHQVDAGTAPTTFERLRARAWRPFDWRSFARVVERQIREVRPDVVHAHFGMTGWRISGLIERLGLPLVVSFYGVDVSQILLEPRWQRRYRQLFRRAAQLVVLCDAAADRLAALGCPRGKLRVWNHPLDLEAYDFRPREPHTPTRLLIGARFVEKKGYPFLLQACASLLRDGRDVTLTAVGYGPGHTRVQARADELGLGERFRLIDTAGIGNFDEFYDRILREHDIFVLPSTTAKSGDDEGGPALSLVLAQASGLPVICTPFVGSERSVIDGETGLLCRQDDSVSLAARIGELIDSPDLAARLAAHANALVRRAFGLETQAAEMHVIYRQAVEAVAGRRLAYETP
jgi:glycosyltransferase involved in cell wall biosynthesis